MPRDSDPGKLRIGPGRAGVGSVSVSSVTFHVGGGGSGAGGTIWAEDVFTTEIPGLLDGNVQANLEEYSGLLPELPNRMGEERNSKNPSVLVDMDPEPEFGLWWDGSANNEAFLVQGTDLEVKFNLFPADRGVLAARVDGEHVAALDLEAVFVEGTLFSETAPSRPVGQNAYAAGSDSSADVSGTSGTITQNVGLNKRLPVATTYELSEYPFLSTTDDPVYSDIYDVHFPAYQLAFAQVVVDFGGVTGDLGLIELVHYKSAGDLVNAEEGDPYEVYSEIDLSEYLDETKADTSFFNDPSTVGVDLDLQSWDPDDFDFTVHPSSSRRWLSGILHYGPDDTYSVSWSAAGLYDDSFLEEGVVLRLWDAQTDESGDVLQYTTYSPAGTAPGDLASFSATGRLMTGNHIGVSVPGVVARRAFGYEDLGVASRKYMWHTTTYGDTSGRLTVEQFTDEATRYDATTAASDLILPDGSEKNGSAYSWDSTTALNDDELQVRAIVPNTGSPAGARSPVDHEGGELAVPNVNYGDGVHHPLTNDGTTPQRDYSLSQQVDFTITDDGASGDDWTITINGIDSTYTDTTATADPGVIADELASAINANSGVNSEVTAASDFVDTVTVTADVFGVPFTFSSTTTGGGSITETVAVAVEDRAYIRSFDVGGSRLEGTLRVVGLSNQSFIFDSFEYQEGAPHAGHPEGMSLWIAPSGVAGQQWLDLGRDWENGNGALVNWTQVDEETVDLDYRLDNYPIYDSGFYPVAVRILVHAGGNEYVAGNLSIIRLEWFPAN